MSVVISGDNGVTGNTGALTAATAVASTSGTSIDFTGIPSWVKRITVMLSGVSTNGTSQVQIQVGSGSVTTSGYLGSVDTSVAGVAASTFTTGLGLERSGTTSAANVRNGIATWCLLSSNTWAASASIGYSNSAGMSYAATSIALGGVLDRIRVTTVNGTDTFDAGSINILYE